MTSAPITPLVNQGYPPWREASFVIAVLFLVSLVSQLDRQLPALLVRPLRQEFGLSDTAFSVLQGYAFALFFTLAGLPLGRWVDRGSRRNLLIAGLVFWSAATALFAFADSYRALLLARVGVGMGEAVLAPAAFSLIADLVPPARRGRALGLYGVSLAVGSGASLLLGGWLLALIPQNGLPLGPLGLMPAWRVTFLCAAALAVPLMALLLAVLEPRRQHDGITTSMRLEQPTVRDFFRYLAQYPATFVRVLGYPTLLALIGYGALAWAPALFERSYGIPAARSGVILGVGVALAGAAGMLSGGFLSDRWLRLGQAAARLRVAVLGFGLLLAPSLTWSQASDPAWAFGLLFVQVFGVSLAQSAVPAAVQAVFPNRLRGQAITLYLLFAGLLGIGLGPTAVALLADKVFSGDGALGRALALGTTPCALLGLWLTSTGLAPYARTEASLRTTHASPD